LNFYREAIADLLGVDDIGASTERFATELNVSKKRSVTAELVLEMDHAELAVSMAAHMVSYMNKCGCYSLWGYTLASWRSSLNRQFKGRCL
jgi:hypothetical protein